MTAAKSDDADSEAKEKEETSSKSKHKEISPSDNNGSTIEEAGKENAVQGNGDVKKKTSDEAKKTDKEKTPAKVCIYYLKTCQCFFSDLYFGPHSPNLLLSFSTTSLILP